MKSASRAEDVHPASRELLERHLHDQPLAVGCAVQLGVVEDDRHGVLGQLYVELEHEPALGRKRNAGMVASGNVGSPSTTGPPRCAWM